MSSATVRTCARSLLATAAAVSFGAGVVDGRPRVVFEFVVTLLD